jgi:hypothetical protein
LLAAIRLQRDEAVIEGEPTEVHRAFYRVLKELREGRSPLTLTFSRSITIRFNGQSGWFDRALERRNATPF